MLFDLGLQRGIKVFRFVGDERFGVEEDGVVCVFAFPLLHVFKLGTEVSMYISFILKERSFRQSQRDIKKIYGRTRTRTSLPRQTQRMPNWYTIRAIS